MFPVPPPVWLDLLWAGRPAREADLYDPARILINMAAESLHQP